MSDPTLHLIDSDVAASPVLASPAGVEMASGTEAALVPEATEAIEASEIPEAPEASEATEAIEASEIPEAPEATEIPEAPAATAADAAPAVDPAFQAAVDAAVAAAVDAALQAAVDAALQAAVDAAVTEAVAAAVQAGEERLLEHIRARGLRPPENGLSGGMGVCLHPAVDRLTRRDRELLARRAELGERVLL